MKRELTEKLLALYEAGYRADEDAMLYASEPELELGDVYFNSQVYSYFPLKNINTLDVTVFEPLADWKNFELV